MLSGLYAHTHNVINNFTDYPADLPSYPRQLQAAGYETACIGKFHMGEQSDEKRPGFDHWVTHTGQGKYDGTINSVDDSVGAVYETLRQMGQLDNTIFIFTTDNPFLLGEHGMIDKRTMHEESIRIPLIVRYPKRIKAGSLIDPMVLSVDLAPSILELCGAPALRNIHGKSVAPLLAGDSANWRKSFLYEYNYEKQFPCTPNVRGVRTERWKYVHYPHGDGGPDRHMAELYDLQNDPQERKNLINDPQYAGQLAELKTELARLMQETGALPDKMPIDEGIKMALPEKAIR